MDVVSVADPLAEKKFGMKPDTMQNVFLTYVQKS